MNVCRSSECGSYALNEHPESGLCDRCYWKMMYERERQRCVNLCDELLTDGWKNLRDAMKGDAALAVKIVKNRIMQGGGK